ncbi:MAG: alkanesulfonate monooxygenase, partial [Mesorhizobium sp.]
AYRFGELVLPHLPTEHQVKAPGSSVNTGPFGETIAGDHRPKSLASAS